jgi:hypothetical protein
MRLFRQARRGDWAELIERVVAELRWLLVAGGAENTGRILAPLPAGDLIDRITNLELSLTRANDNGQGTACRRELVALTALRRECLPESGEMTRLTDELRRINGSLQDAEETLRACAQAEPHDGRLVELARAVAHGTAERAAMKRRIDRLVGGDGQKLGVGRTSACSAGTCAAGADERNGG